VLSLPGPWPAAIVAGNAMIAIGNVAANGVRNASSAGLYERTTQLRLTGYVWCCRARGGSTAALNSTLAPPLRSRPQALSDE